MKKEHIKLSTTEEAELKSMLTKGSLRVKTSKRILSLLELNKGQTYKVVSGIVQLSEKTLSRLVKTYNLEGLSCLYDKERPGRPIKIDTKQVDLLTVLSCSEAPQGYAQWSLRLLAGKMVELNHSTSISHTQVRNILKKENKTTSI